MTSGASRGRVAVVAVCAAAAVPYLRTVRDYFVQDDFGVVQLLAARPWTTFPRWFTMPWMEDIWGYTPDEIRPFPALSYQVTALWGASAPEGHHLLNIALHAATAWLVLEIARRVAGAGLAGATTAGLAFALLPVAAESVAWITGRVDSMPTLFYLASFLAYARWRASPGPAPARLYIASLVWFFFALFSKQNTITLAPALMAYDVIVARRPVRFAWSWLRPYVPFILMTAGFLALRYAVLGEVLRESQLSSQRVTAFGAVVYRHLERIVFGEIGGVPPWVAVLGVAGVCWIGLAVARRERSFRARALRGLLYFGPVWLALGLLPALAAGYESPRHAYLAAAGWAVVLGIGADALWRRAGSSASPARARAVAAVAIAVVLGAYAARLHVIVSDWRQRAEVSSRTAAALEREALAAPPGTLLLVGAPVASWEWAAPFVARPPYSSVDLTTRVFVITPRVLDCCRGRQWEERTRTQLDAWRAQAGAAAIALHATPDGVVRRLAADDDLQLLLRVLPEIPSADGLDAAMRDILRGLVAARGQPVAPWRERR